MKQTKEYPVENQDFIAYSLRRLAKESEDAGELFQKTPKKSAPGRT